MFSVHKANFLMVSSSFHLYLILRANKDASYIDVQPIQLALYKAAFLHFYKIGVNSLCFTDNCLQIAEEKKSTYFHLT